jgi:hypothetical protein
MSEEKFEYDRRSISPETPHGMLIQKYNREVTMLREQIKQVSYAVEVVEAQEKKCAEWKAALEHFETLPKQSE